MKSFAQIVQTRDGSIIIVESREHIRACDP